MPTTEEVPEHQRGVVPDSIEAARELATESAEEGQQIVFEEGFTWKVVVGAFFVGLIMLPGAIYLGLVAGQSLGAAAQWVTIVLFSEVARRSFLPLKRQEIFCIYYMAGALAATGFGWLPGISGGPFGNFISLAYLIQSAPMAPVAHHLPGWVAPHPASTAYIQRTFLDHAWLVPAGILIFTQVLSRMSWMGLGYVLFKITSDVERLPFPLATVAASGATALAEASSKEESWRWQVFSVGSIIGLVFGFFYLGIPIFTGVAFGGTPLTLLPIPFIDLTTSTEHILPTALVGYNPDLGAILLGFVLPYQIVLGSFISSVVCQIGLNPILYYHGMFPDFIKGSPAIQAQISLSMDFWLSIGIGTQFAIAAIGLVAVAKVLLFRGAKADNVKRASLASRNLERGDFPITAAIGAFLVATLGYIWLNHKLMPLFPLEILIFYGLVWTPLNSYISARMIGLTGNGVSFPYLNQAVVLYSHYTRPDVWFAPLPLADYGGQAQNFRSIELTGTKFTSILKLELFMLPLILITSFAYWGFLWHTTEIPSSQFPYAQKFWPINSVITAMWTQINAAGGAGSWVMKAIKYPEIGIGFGGGLVLYFITALFRAPLFFYGLMGGIGNFPHFTIPTFIGALLGRYYFSKRFGFERWNLYAPVLLAGFGCGTGLIGMAAISFALISKTVNYLPF